MICGVHTTTTVIFRSLAWMPLTEIGKAEDMNNYSLSYLVETDFPSPHMIHTTRKHVHFVNIYLIQ